MASPVDCVSVASSLSSPETVSSPGPEYDEDGNIIAAASVAAVAAASAASDDDTMLVEYNTTTSKTPTARGATSAPPRSSLDRRTVRIKKLAHPMFSEFERYCCSTVGGSRGALDAALDRARVQKYARWVADTAGVADDAFAVWAPSETFASGHRLRAFLEHMERMYGSRPQTISNYMLAVRAFFAWRSHVHGAAGEKQISDRFADAGSRELGRISTTLSKGSRRRNAELMKSREWGKLEQSGEIVTLEELGELVRKDMPKFQELVARLRSDPTTLPTMDERNFALGFVIAFHVASDTQHRVGTLSQLTLEDLETFAASIDEIVVYSTFKFKTAETFKCQGLALSRSTINVWVDWVRWIRIGDDDPKAPLFTTPRGKPNPNLSKAFIEFSHKHNKHLTTTALRAAAYSQAVDALSPGDVSAITAIDTHSSATARGHYYRTEAATIAKAAAAATRKINGGGVAYGANDGGVADLRPGHAAVAHSGPGAARHCPPLALSVRSVEEYARYNGAKSRADAGIRVADAAGRASVKRPAPVDDDDDIKPVIAASKKPRFAKQCVRIRWSDKETSHVLRLLRSNESNTLSRWKIDLDGHPEFLEALQPEHRDPKKIQDFVRRIPPESYVQDLD